MDKKYKPGEIASRSGQYKIVGPRGSYYGERTIVKGEPFPPTPKKGLFYILVDATKNGAGKA